MTAPQTNTILWYSNILTRLIRCFSPPLIRQSRPENNCHNGINPRNKGLWRAPDTFIAGPKKPLQLLYYGIPSDL